MAFTKYTVGLLEEMSAYSSAQQSVNNSAGARQSPYYSIYVSANQWFRYDLPEQVNELWLSECLSTATLGSVAITGRLTSLRKADGVTELMYLIIDRDSQIVTAYVNGVARGTFPTSLGVLAQIEIRFKRDSSAGVLQIWKDGTLVVNFSGDTGSAADSIGSVYWSAGVGSAACYFYTSDIVVTTEGRVGNKRPIIVPLTGAGDSSAPTYYDCIGNYASATTGNLTVGRTFISKQVFASAGILKNVTVNFGTTGTCYLGICTRNQSTPTKHTRRLVSSQITIGATGLKTFVAGVDFPSDWTIAAGECLAIYAETAQLKYASATADNNKYNTDGAYYYTGNGLSGTSELTYTTGTSSYFECINAQYQVTDSSIAYSMSASADKLARKDFIETLRYAEFAAENDQMLCPIGDLPIVCTGVKSIKVSARAVSGTSLANADWRLKIGTDDLATQAAIPTTMSLKSVQFDGTWSPAAFNNAQIGFKAKT